MHAHATVIFRTRDVFYTKRRVILCFTYRYYCDVTVGQLLPAVRKLNENVLIGFHARDIVLLAMFSAPANVMRMNTSFHALQTTFYGCVFVDFKSYMSLWNCLCCWNNNNYTSQRYTASWCIRFPFLHTSHCHGEIDLPRATPWHIHRKYVDTDVILMFFFFSFFFGIHSVQSSILNCRIYI